MGRIDELFARLRHQQRRAFMPFLTAGDPDLEATVLFARTLAAAGANLIEIGFPYSDPIADGPVIQASYTRALDRGVKLAGVFDTVARIARELPDVPLVAMVSYSLIWRRGPEAFLQQLRNAGAAGLIVPDLPYQDPPLLVAESQKAGLALVQLITPTTPVDRALRIVKASAGFVYCVSVAGITGERDRLPEELVEQLAWLRQQTALPLCVGFGVSRAEHALMLRDHADGIIVGSALVKQIEAGGPAEVIANRMEGIARPLVEALAT